MQNNLGAPGGGFRQTAYIFLAGLLIGVLIGWSMHGLIGFILRMALIAVIIGLVVVAVNFWMSTRKAQKSGTIDAAWRDPRGPGSTR
jgi:multisubunit Na+/H+ antiporter MnhB subunit